MTGAGIVKLLDELEFSVGCIVETIVTTRDQDSLPNAAPMGVTRKGPDILEIKPFKSSATYRNLLMSKDACVNITGDPELFITTAFKHAKMDGFKQPLIDENLSLRGADACILVEIMESHELPDDRGCFICKAHTVDVHHPLPTVFSRGRAEAIEAIIHATRIDAYLRMGLSEEAEKRNIKFNECKKIVERVSATNSSEMRVIRALENLIKGWREGASK